MPARMAYAVAALVIAIWGTTFISTKVLLDTLTPVEIMVYRYVLGYMALWAAHPTWHKPESIREELCFLGAGFFGGTLYFLTENYALKYSLASNVGLLVASSPILTALAARCLLKGETLGRGVVFGFVVAFSGIFLVMFNGHFVLKLNPLGDLLAVAAAGSWAVYSILIKTMPARHGGVHLTRKVFFYSLLTMSPLLLTDGFHWDAARLSSWPVAANLLFLGILASAVCFLLWSTVIWNIGPVRANNFIYMVPLVTMITSVIVLREPVTVFAVTGGVLILAGVYLASAGDWLLHRLRLKRITKNPS